MILLCEKRSETKGYNYPFNEAISEPRLYWRAKNEAGDD